MLGLSCIRLSGICGFVVNTPLYPAKRIWNALGGSFLSISIDTSKRKVLYELTRDGGNTAPALLWILIRLIKLRRIFVPYIIVRVYFYRLILSIDITDYAYHFFFKIFDVVLLV